MSKKPTLKELEEQIAQLHDSLLRERADAMNVRKRAEEERSKLASFYKALVVRELLPAIDNLERAIKAVPPDLSESDYVKGVLGVSKQFATILQKIGVERIKTVGEPFNPELHEAVTMEEGDGIQEIVSEELQSGYTLGNEVIRHAMVRVKLS